MDLKLHHHALGPVGCSLRFLVCSSAECVHSLIHSFLSLWNVRCVSIRGYNDDKDMTQRQTQKPLPFIFPFDCASPGWENKAEQNTTK